MATSRTNWPETQAKVMNVPLQALLIAATIGVLALIFGRRGGC